MSGEQKTELPLAVVLIFVIIMVLRRLGVSCPILYLTGVSCAGCGMTRAWLSLLRLDLPGALGFHPLFWMPAVWGILWLQWNRLPEQGRRYLTFFSVAAMLMVYGLRMISPQNSIVVFQPENGLIFRIITHFLNGIR